MEKFAVLLLSFTLANLALFSVASAQTLSEGASNSTGVLRENFDNQSATAKLDQIWKLVTSSKYVARKLPEYPQGTKVKRTLTLRLANKCILDWRTYFLATTGDLQPANVTSSIGKYGVVGRVQYVPIGQHSTYTGIFQHGGRGLIRLTQVVNPYSHTPNPASPAATVKIFRSSLPSVNLHTALIPSSDTNLLSANFFARNLTVPQDVGRVIEAYKKVWQQSIKLPRSFAPFKLTMEPFAAATAKGVKVEKPKAPESVMLVPARRLANVIDPSSSIDSRQAIMDLVTPGPLYQVYAISTGGGSDPILIGNIDLIKSKMVASKFGDESLFFQPMRKLSAKAFRQEIS